MQTLKYTPIRNQPLWKFWYQGTHSHPVRRTVLVTQITDNLITGYELREGKKTRNAFKAPVKSYLREKIAMASSLRANNPLRKQSPEATTLQKCNLLDGLAQGL